MARKSASTKTKTAKKAAKSSKQNLPTATVKEMANRLNPSSPYYEHEQNKRPHFAVFLGAGASVESGIPSANQMISDFIKRICAVECPDIKKDIEKDKWLKDNGYYETEGDKYGSLFERCFPTEVDRREYVESKVDGKVASLGYIALAHLIKSKIVDTIITTNFDDLIYTACTSYTDIRPVVYSLGNFASEIGATANRSRVLKLHGDFLFSSLKNTKKEITNQDVNMSQQVQQILEAYRGIIVIGYSGNDDSIVDLLSKIPNNKYFYWCVYKDEKPNKNVEKLIKDKNGWIVRTEGFDKLFNEIREVVGIKDADIFNLFDERRKKIEEELKKFNPKEYVRFDEATKFFREGHELQAIGKLAEAELAYRKAIEINPNYYNAYCNLGYLLTQNSSQYQEAEKILRKAIELYPENDLAYFNLGHLFDKDFIRFKEAEWAFRKALECGPNNVHNYLSLAYLLDKDNFYHRESEVILREAQNKFPRNARVLSNLAYLVGLDDSRLEEAAQLYIKAIKIDPEYPKPYNYLGIILYQQGRTLRAEGFFIKALKKDNVSITALLCLAALNKKLGRTQMFNQYILKLEALINSDVLYDRACFEAVLEENNDKVIKLLKDAVKKESYKLPWIKRFPCFEWIRDDLRFKEFIEKKTKRVK